MARDNRNIVFLPDWTDGNPYLNCLSGALRDDGFNVTIVDYPLTRLPISSVAESYPQAGVIHIHWIAPLIDQIYWSENWLKRTLKYWYYYCCIALDIKLARRQGVRIIWTVHNILNHESRNSKVELRLRRLLARLVDGLCFHSEEAKDLVLREYGLRPAGRVSITPHACYGEYYGPRIQEREPMRLKHGFEPGQFVYLFFGNIRRYKGVDLLVESFSTLEGANLRLVIAGQVLPAQDEAWLAEVVQKDPRIIFRRGFVPEEDLAGLILAADVVVLPFSRTLSSGSALLAITYGRPLVLPDRARVFGVPGEQGAIYFGGERSLKEAMRLVEISDLEGLGWHNYRLAERLTWANMAGALARCYRAD